MNVLIVDDHPIVISGFKALLEHEPSMIVLAAASARAASDILDQTPIDILVIDIDLPHVSGFELARETLARDPTTRIIMFSMNDDAVFVSQAKAIGARGYVSKNDDPARMLDAIRIVADGGGAWPQGIKGASHNGESPTNEITLSDRERDVLSYLVRGKSLSEIAELVGVSYKTIAGTCASLRVRFQARTQAELIAKAFQRGLV